MVQEDELPPVLESQTQTPAEIQVYRRRWFVALVVAVMNMTNAMLWISYSSITDYTSIFYQIDYNSVNYLALVFPIICIPLGLFSSWLLDTMGLKVAMLLCGILDLSGAVLRFVSALPCSHGIYVHQSSRYPLAMAGQSLAAIAQPFVLFASTKTAAVWFPESQCAIANTLVSMANPLGILIANLLSPNIVKSPDHILILQIVYGCPALLAMFLSLGMFCTGTSPPLPPSHSAYQHQHRESSFEYLPVEDSGRAAPDTVRSQFCTDLKSALQKPQFWILMISFGMGVGLFTSLSTLLEQILCPRGYTDTYSGICGALLIAFGIVGAGIAGTFVDVTKKFIETAKICYGLAAVGSAAFAVLSAYRNFHIPIAASVGWFGWWGFSLYPVCLELGVEITYPVGEAISTGLMLLTGQVFSVILIFFMQLIASDLPPELAHLARCAQPNSTYAGAQTPAQDYQVPVLIFAGLAAASSVLLIAVFHTPYRRQDAERQARSAHSTGSQSATVPT